MTNDDIISWESFWGRRKNRNSQARLAKRDVRSVHVAKMILKDLGMA